jgi:hypothetical protein
MNQAPRNEIPDTLADLDWREITCQSDTGCTNLATHIVHLHAVDECNNPDFDSSGNLIGILCVVCVHTLSVQVQQRVGWLTRHPGVYCLTCGAEVREPKDVIRNIAAL